MTSRALKLLRDSFEATTDQKVGGSSPPERANLHAQFNLRLVSK